VNKSKILVSIGIAFALLFFVSRAKISFAGSEARSLAPTAEFPSQDDNTQKKAARVWEQALAAKGGRDKLHRISNIAVSTEARLTKKNRIRREEFCVFPDKYWFWDDYRPSNLGLTIMMYDYANKTSYMVTNGEVNKPPELNEYWRRAPVALQLEYLLESRWVAPKVIRSMPGHVEQRAVDNVETLVNSNRVDFSFDQETHLLLRVRYYDVPREHTFSDYVDVGGLKVPSKVDYGDQKYSVRIQFNVTYNESIFLKPPPMSAGPEAWRRKTG